MKKIIISLIALVALSTAAHAQYNNALGIRAGYGTAFGAELSYQTYLGNINRVELDLGARLYTDYSALSLAAIYQWHWFLAGGFGFYIGPGAEAFLSDHTFGIGVGGQIGIDYQFNAPFQISLDWRPIYDFVGHVPGDNRFNYGGALGIRYAF